MVEIDTLFQTKTAKKTPFSTTHTYIAYIRDYLPPGAKNALQIMSLAAYASETNNVLIISIILAKRDLHNDVSWRLLWRFIGKHGMSQSVFTGRQVPRRDVSFWAASLRRLNPFNISHRKC